MRAGFSISEILDLKIFLSLGGASEIDYFNERVFNERVFIRMTEQVEYSTRDLHAGKGFDLCCFPYMPVSCLHLYI